MRAGIKKISCLKNALDASSALISATLYKDVNPIINIPKMIMINPNGDDFIDLVKLAIIDC
jgi:hypothetical protein